MANAMKKAIWEIAKKREFARWKNCGSEADDVFCEFQRGFLCRTSIVLIHSDRCGKSLIKSVVRRYVSFDFSRAAEANGMEAKECR